MLIDALLQLLPAEPGRSGMIIAIAGAVIGLLAWLCGARFSRPVVTLLTVALGTMLGLYVPRFFGWSFSGPAPAIATALVFGVTGYLLHFLWVGVGLGLIAATWAAIACWIKLHHNAAWTYPTWAAGETPMSFAAALWHGLPTNISHILPLIIAAALVCGVAFSIVWPKASLLLGWSCAGVTTLVIMGLAVVQYGQPKLLNKLDSPLWAQLATLTLLVAIGTLMNWLLSPKVVVTKPPGGKGGGKKSPPRDDQDD